MKEATRKVVVFILRQRGPGPLPDQVVEVVKNHPGLQIIERSTKMLRVEGTSEDLQAVTDGQLGLQFSEERQYSPVKPFQESARPPRRKP
ncbi:uncharacterized protein (DUF1499 family) [Nitrobacter vulgaris]|uniref:HMA domain-containing protein n=1 Tax=Nitrobacter vulgaris TaxID=29421 RepID=A0A1V4I1J9_NITVU|nr:hypothetical protein [Nitrobacter vulgaris]MDR6305004.1 uncharacterized protein (DUF1499 family) [Nitrobacter vulgaris]OPH84005.1 hypothetical protein B2M20_04030 [Nitrobacter vulgaris]